MGALEAVSMTVHEWAGRELLVLSRQRWCSAKDTIQPKNASAGNAAVRYRLIVASLQ